MKRSSLRLVLLMLGVVLLSFILLVLHPGSPAALSDPPTLIQEPTATAPSPYRYGQGQLSRRLEQGYEALVDALNQGENSSNIELPSDLTTAEIQTIIQYVQDDHPSFYWAVLTPETGKDAHGILLHYKEGYTQEIVTRRNQELADYALQFLAPLKEATDFEKALAIHDTIATTVIYDYGFKKTDSENAYGALVEGAAYCDGYARAFQYLADQAGLPNAYLRGWDKKGTAHAWNAVQLGGSWYDVDVTWDRASTSYGGAYHDFFAITREESLRARIWDSSQYPQLPPAPSAPYSYFDHKAYTIDLTRTPTFSQSIPALSSIYLTQLSTKDNLTPELAYTFLELKILGDPADYQRWKGDYLKNVSQLLDALDRAAQQEGTSYRISLDTAVSCYFNDSIQTLSFYPRVKQVAEPPPKPQTKERGAQ